MLKNKAPDEQINVLVMPQPVEVVFAEDSDSPLSVVLEPLDDLAEMSDLTGRGFSIKEFARAGQEKLEQRFLEELANLETKKVRFSHSSVLFNRLANLAHAAGKLDAENFYLDRAEEISPEPFYLHRKGANLIARHRLADAEHLFKSLDLQSDVEANLRIAYLYVQRNDIEQARETVEKALEIDPSDFGARLFEGAIRLVEGRYESAVHSFRIAAEERPTSSALFCNLAVAYVALKAPDKALASLRRSVALNPLNISAITLLSDVAFQQKCNEDAIPSLRYFLQFEQKNETVWGRLARALLEIGQFDEAIAALKRQGSIHKTSALWNNLGVAYYRKNDRKRALESFKKAMELATPSPGRDFYLPARNAALVFSQNGAMKELLRFSELVLSTGTSKDFLSDRQLCDLYSFWIHALFESGKEEEAVAASESIVANKNAAVGLVIWAVIGLLSWYSLNGNRSRALALAEQFGSLANTLPLSDAHLRDRLLNNIAFVYADAGNVEAADRFLSQISHSIHKDPYATATLGLMHLRKSHLDRAVGLYNEAIGLAFKEEDKARIRQKLNFELGCYWLTKDATKAARFLQKAQEEKRGEKGIANETKRTLSELRRLR